MLEKCSVSNIFQIELNGECISFPQDVIGVKSLESFSQVETEEVEGEGGVVTSEVDDFTVETSLEDLEFGFNISNSTQKVRNVFIAIGNSSIVTILYHLI